MAYEEADSDREDNRFSRHPSGGSNSRGNREAPMQQKRTRKREKVSVPSHAPILLHQMH